MVVCSRLTLFRRSCRSRRGRASTLYVYPHVSAYHLRCFDATEVPTISALDADSGFVQDGLEGVYFGAFQGPALGEHLAAEPSEHSLREQAVDRCNVTHTTHRLGNHESTRTYERP